MDSNFSNRILSNHYFIRPYVKIFKLNGLRSVKREYGNVKLIDKVIIRKSGKKKPQRHKEYKDASDSLCSLWFFKNGVI